MFPWPSVALGGPFGTAATGSQSDEGAPTPTLTPDSSPIPTPKRLRSVRFWWSIVKPLHSPGYPE